MPLTFFTRFKMKFNLTCDLDNAAFNDDPSGLELARILHTVINKVEDLQELDTDAYGKVRDLNGNTICSWGVTDG